MATDGLSLQIAPKLPPFPFKAKPYTTKIYLTANDLNGSLKHPPKPFVVNVEVYLQHVQLAQAPEGSLSCNQPLVVQTNGTCDFTLMFNSVSMRFENRPFLVRLVPHEPPVELPAIEPAILGPFTVVQHALSVPQSLPTIWYKDEGGRDKTIDVSVKLVDSDEQVVVGREVPLQIVLHYDTGDKPVVDNQDILRILSRPSIGPSGVTTLKFRIEEVSKNHQKQMFCLEIKPNTAQVPNNFDIAGTITTAVTIRSKRSTRKRKKDTAAAAVQSTYSKRWKTGMQQKGQPVSLEPPQDASVPTPEQLSKLQAVTPGVLEKLHQSQSTLGQDVHAVVNFCQFLVSALASFEWGHVADLFAKEYEGPDPRTPLYRCPGCWTYKDTLRPEAGDHLPTCPILKIIADYGTHIKPALQYLVQHANQHTHDPLYPQPTPTPTSMPGDVGLAFAALGGMSTGLGLSANTDGKEMGLMQVVQQHAGSAGNGVGPMDLDTDPGAYESRVGWLPGTDTTHLMRGFSGVLGNPAMLRTGSVPSLTQMTRDVSGFSMLPELHRLTSSGLPGPQVTGMGPGMLDSPALTRGFSTFPTTFDAGLGVGEGEDKVEVVITERLPNGSLPAFTESGQYVGSYFCVGDGVLMWMCGDPESETAASELFQSHMPVGGPPSQSVITRKDMITLERLREAVEVQAMHTR